MRKGFGTEENWGACDRSSLHFLCVALSPSRRCGRDLKYAAGAGRDFLCVGCVT